MKAADQRGYSRAQKTLCLTLAGIILGFVPTIEDGFELTKAIALRLGSLMALGIFLWDSNQESDVSPQQRPLQRPLLLFLCLAVFFTVFSIEPQSSFFGQYRLYWGGLWSFIAGSTLYWVSARLPSSKTSTAVQHTLLASGLAALSYVLIQRMGWDPFAWRASTELKPIGTFGSPFKLAPFLALLVPSLGSAYLAAKKPATRVFWMAALLYALCELLATTGRGAWLGCLFGIAVWMALNRDLLRDQRKSALLLIGTFVATILLLGLFGGDEIQTRMAVFLNSRETSAANRIELWRMALRAITDRHAWGSGLDTFGLISPAYETAAFRTGVGLSEVATNAHNEILQICVTMGLPGLTAYAWLWGAFFIFGWRRIAELQGPDKLVLSGLFTGVIALWVYAQFNFATTATYAIAWCVFGLIDGIGQAQRPAQSDSRARKVQAMLVGGLLIVAGVYCAREVMADWYFKRASALMGRQSWLKAVDAGQRALALNPKNGYAAVQLSSGYRKLSQLATERSEKSKWLASASELFKENLRRHPNDPDSYHNYATSLMWRAFDLGDVKIDEPIKIQMNAVRLAPMIPDFWNMLGQMQHFAGDIDAAKKSWVQAIDVAPGYAPAREWLEKYVPRDVFQLSPTDLVVRNFPLGRPVSLDADMGLTAKLANLSDQELHFTAEVISAIWHPRPEGYGSSAAVRIKVLTEQLNVAPNDVSRIPLEIYVPNARRFRNKKYCLFVRLRCHNFDVPVDQILRVLIDTQGESS